MVNDCSRLLIPLINLVFNKNYLPDEEVELHHNEHFIRHKDGTEEKRVTDSFFIIGGDMYILECQSTNDNTMIVRIVEYGFLAALESAKINEDTLEMDFPNTAILYLRSYSTTPDKMKVKIRGLGSSIVPIIKMKDYKLEDLFEKKLYFLLPFFIFNHEKDFKVYNSDPSELQQEYMEIFNKLEQAMENGELAKLDVGTILDMSQKVLDGLAEKYENIRKGVDFVMGGKVLEYTSKTMYNAGRNEEQQRVARDMLKENLPLALIAKISKLSEDVIRNLAGSLGVSIV